MTSFGIKFLGNKKYIDEYRALTDKYILEKGVNTNLNNLTVYLYDEETKKPDFTEADILIDVDKQSFEDFKDYLDPYFFEYTKMLQLFADTAYEASKSILEIYNNDFNVEYKEDKSPVTLADKKSNDIISNTLKSFYPDYAILAEETQQSYEQIKERMENPFCFIVDPLDGTKEFVKKNGEFTINIALSYKNRVITGVIYIPITKTIYYAAKGKGAYKSGIDKVISGRIFEKEDRIYVSDRTSKLIVMHSKSSFDADTREIVERNKEKISALISKGSAIKMCTIAEGLADVYYRKGYTMEWDTAAGQIIIEEAGGVFRQLDENNSEMLYNRLDSCNRNGFYILNKYENRFI